MEHEALDKLLQQRDIPAPRSSLAEDIIAQAVNRPSFVKGAPERGWRKFIFDLQTGLALPHPVMTLAFVLFLGMVLGVEAEALTALSQEDVSSFLYIDEEWL